MEKKVEGQKKTWKNLHKRNPPIQEKYDLTGKKFGRLTVIKYFGKGKYKALRWECQCECGGKSITLGKDLRKGTTKSCGCLLVEWCKNNHVTHGMRHTPEYSAWASMKDRCLRKTNLNYYRYGGRGIKICKRWINSFENFYSDLGKRPDGFSLERKNNDGDYKPSNCIWSAKESQMKNRSISIKVNLMEIAKSRGISYQYAWALHKNGRLLK